MEEESCDYSDTDESSDENYDRFSSPRPAQPPEHAPTTRAKNIPAFFPHEILIRDGIAEEPFSEPFVLKQRIRKRQDGIDIRGADKTCRTQEDLQQGNDRIRRKKRRSKQSKTNSLEIILAVILAIITIVMEPTTNEAPTRIDLPVKSPLKFPMFSHHAVHSLVLNFHVRARVEEMPN